MDNLTTNNQLAVIWDKYNQVRIAGDKKNANKLLADYISLLKKEDEKTIENFVNNICSSTLDIEAKVISNNGAEVSSKNTRIQHPLFKEIILPILKDQYKKGSAKHIKWIGQFEQFFYNDYATTTVFLKELNIIGHFETRHFFEKSFAHENNQETLTLLLNRIAQDIDYYTHEVPTIVLADPEVLDKELMIFRQYWQQSETKHIWEPSLTEWELIAKHWTLYNMSKNKYGNFEDFLEKNEIRFGNI